MSLLAYDTLAGKKVEFAPRERGKVLMYVCGPTVYNYIHVGNARTYVSFDTIWRYLKFRGYDVTYVRNITDVDDKIINRASEEGITPAEIAQRYSEAFREDAEALGLGRPDVEPKATEHIPEMLDMVKGLVDRGIAYVVDGDVYYSIAKFAGYGKLAHRTLDEMRAGERVEVDPRKKHPMDFALWKAAKPGEPAWDSPWGKGRPGWHIECSAMSLRYLGMGFDIHGGGRDLIFPHHENEIAQAEGYAGTAPFVRHWLHGGMLNIGEEKMAKSVGNIIRTREMLEDHSAEAFRMFCLSTHYRSPIDFSVEKLREAAAAHERLLNVVRRLEQAIEAESVTRLDDPRERIEGMNAGVTRAREEFIVGMDDDFNTAAALSAVFDLARETNTFLEAYEGGLSIEAREVAEAALEALRELSGALGLELRPPEFEDPERVIPEEVLVFAADLLGPPAAAAVDRSREKALKALIERREAAREARDWALADRIRGGLMELGIEIEDTPYGTRWKAARRS